MKRLRQIRRFVATAPLQAQMARGQLEIIARNARAFWLQAHPEYEFPQWEGSDEEAEAFMRALNEIDQDPIAEEPDPQWHEGDRDYAAMEDEHGTTDPAIAADARLADARPLQRSCSCIGTCDFPTHEDCRGLPGVR
jgi:hypothetical protein